jgi:hypothetical protein
MTLICFDNEDLLMKTIQKYVKLEDIDVYSSVTHVGPDNGQMNSIKFVCVTSRATYYFSEMVYKDKSQSRLDELTDRILSFHSGEINYVKEITASDGTVRIR